MCSRVCEYLNFNQIFFLFIKDWITTSSHLNSANNCIITIDLILTNFKITTSFNEAWWARWHQMNTYTVNQSDRQPDRHLIRQTANQTDRRQPIRGTTSQPNKEAATKSESPPAKPAEITMTRTCVWSAQSHEQYKQTRRMLYMEIISSNNYPNAWNCTTMTKMKLYCMTWLHTPFNLLTLNHTNISKFHTPG